MMIDNRQTIAEELAADLEKQRGRRTLWVRLFAGLVAIALVLLSLNGIIHLLRLPSVTLLVESLKLSQDQAISAFSESIVAVSADDRRGTGFTLAPGDRVLTNAHVIQDAETVTIRLGSGEIIEVTEYDSDPALDLTLIPIPQTSEGLALSDKAIEEPLYMIGNPLGFFRIISSITYLGTVNDASWPEPLGVIRGPIYQGNSGSPIIGAAGTVHGVLFATTELTLDGQEETTVGLMIPSSLIRKFLSQIDDE